MRQAGTHAEQRQRDDQRGIACPANTALEGLKWNLSVLHRVFFLLLKPSEAYTNKKAIHVLSCSFMFVRALSFSIMFFQYLAFDSSPATPQLHHPDTHPASTPMFFHVL
jgi:hypothetical protein